jgi:hypothetical protein
MITEESMAILNQKFQETLEASNYTLKTADKATRTKIFSDHLTTILSFMKLL